MVRFGSVWQHTFHSISYTLYVAFDCLTTYSSFSSYWGFYCFQHRPSEFNILWIVFVLEFQVAFSTGLRNFLVSKLSAPTSKFIGYNNQSRATFTKFCTPTLPPAVAVGVLLPMCYSMNLLYQKYNSILTVPILTDQSRALSTLEILQHRALKLQWSKGVPALLTFVVFVTPCWKTIATTICTDEISFESAMVSEVFCTPVALVEHLSAFTASVSIATQRRSPRSLDVKFATENKFGSET